MKWATKLHAVAYWSLMVVETSSCVIVTGVHRVDVVTIVHIVTARKCSHHQSNYIHMYHQIALKHSIPAAH